MSYKKKQEFQAFLKKVMKRKGKKSNISISRTRLYTQKIKFCMQVFFSKNVYLNTKINLRLKKNKKFLGAISKILFCRRHQKNASHTISIYGNCITSVFFSENRN